MWTLEGLVGKLMDLEVKYMDLQYNYANLIHEYEQLKERYENRNRHRSENGSEPDPHCEDD